MDFLSIGTFGVGIILGWFWHKQHTTETVRSYLKERDLTWAAIESNQQVIDYLREQLDKVKPSWNEARSEEDEIEV